MLRQEYEVFTFEDFSINDKGQAFDVVFHFNLADKFFFNPSLSIPKVTLLDQKIPETAIESLLFNIGMIELISYWKATCSPLIVIKPFSLSKVQLDFWKKIYFNGLGEFFYLNGIVNDQASFVDFEIQSKRTLNKFNLSAVPDRVILPVGGGKDSVVTLELLKNRFDVMPFSLNPRKATDETIRIAGFNSEKAVRAYRIIDPVLLELNEKGFLNGHTPFSALLGFLSLMVAALSGSKYIALSNESSANEPTLKTGVNHQYSKSYEFESDFRCYVSEFMTDDIEYFSFLRPLNEYQIADIFSLFPQHFDSFRSCNVGSKTDTWCGQCSKCLFSYIILSPFIEKGRLEKIFPKNLFKDLSLKPLLRELTGADPSKPFDCVGTKDEVILALNNAVRIYQYEMPVLLEYFLSEIAPFAASAINNHNIADGFDSNHFLNDRFLEILNSFLHD